MSLVELIANRGREIEVPVPVVDGDGKAVLVRVLLWDACPEGGIAKLLRQAVIARDDDPKYVCGRWLAALRFLSLEVWVALARAGESISLPMLGSAQTLDRLSEDWSAMIVLVSVDRVIVALLPEDLMGHDGCEACANKFLAEAN